MSQARTSRVRSNARTSPNGSDNLIVVLATTSQRCPPFRHTASYQEILCAGKDNEKAATSKIVEEWDRPESAEGWA